MTYHPVLSPRTLISDGAACLQARLAKGLTREEYAYQSHLLVESLARREVTARERGRFYRRYQSRSRSGQLAGLGKAAIANMEAGRPVLVFSLVIAAETLGVPLERLVLSTGSGVARAAAGIVTDPDITRQRRLN
jgi:hypothetical protein